MGLVQIYWAYPNYKCIAIKITKRLIILFDGLAKINNHKNKEKNAIAALIQVKNIDLKCHFDSINVSWTDSAPHWVPQNDYNLKIMHTQTQTQTQIQAHASTCNSLRHS